MKMFIKIIKAITPYGIIVLLRNSKKRIIKERLLTARIMQAGADGENEFERLYRLDIWSDGGESLSGSGSYAAHTKRIRRALPEMWKKYRIKTVLDAPCGDFNYMKRVDKTGIEYTGCDIVDSVVENNVKLYSGQNVKFCKLDITKDDLPKVDMIICKDCLQHLSHENVHKALDNFKKSGSTYLLVTSYPLTHCNWDIKDGGYRPLNLCIEPFNLQNPLEKINEPKGGDIDRTEYLFEL
jgi:SAM-dependent methyltransferase